MRNKLVIQGFCWVFTSLHIPVLLTLTEEVNVWGILGLVVPGCGETGKLAICVWFWVRGRIVIERMKQEYIHCEERSTSLQLESGK